MTNEKNIQNSIDQGRFETSEENFNSTVKGISEQSILSFDLKVVAPELFVKSETVPRTLARLCRKACDETLEQYRGTYTCPRGTVVRLYFFDIPAAMGKSKVEAITERLRESLQLAKDHTGAAEIIRVDAADSGKEGPKKVGQSNPEISKILKEGLGVNPKIESVHFWVSRVMQNMLMGQQKFPITREMAEIAAQSEVQYLPFWNHDSQVMSGSLVVVRSTVPTQQYHTGEVMRQDLAGLFAACLQIRSLQIKNANALAVVPFRLQTVMDKNVSEFILAFLRALPAEIKRSLIIEVRGIPASAVSTNLIATIERISHFVRAYSFDTGILSNVSYARSFPKLYGCGFDVSEVPMPEDELIRLIQKYAENQKKNNMKYYIKGVTSQTLFDTATKAGYSFVSGSYIRPMQKICWPAQQMTVSMIKNPSPLAETTEQQASLAGENAVKGQSAVQ